MADEKNCTSLKKPPDKTSCMNSGALSAAVQHIAGFGAGNAWDLWWGVTRSEHIKNAGLVIGYISQTTDKKKGRHRWRLDYDDVKGIHLNEDWDNDSNSKQYHIVTNIDAMPLPAMPMPANLGDYNGTLKVLWMLVSMTKYHLQNGQSPDNKTQIIIGNKFGDVSEINNSSQKWNALEQKILNFQDYDVYASPWTVHG